MKTIPLAVKQTSLFGKMVGLIGKKRPESLLLHTRFGIHTFGLRYPIDVIILNRHKTVVKLTSSLQPNRLFFWNPLFVTVLELPNKTIQKKRITLGDVIKFT